MPGSTSNAHAALDQLDLDDLYAELAIAEAGTEPDLEMALKSISDVRSMMTADNVAAGASIGGLIRKGKRIFNRYWPAVKDAVCNAWEQYGDDFIEKAADALSTLLRLPRSIVIIILKIAVKKGMDAVCDTDSSPQPA